MPAASVQVPRVESEKTPWLTVKLSYPLRTAILALLVAVVSYVACWLGGIIILHSQGISVLWPACAVLVSVMLLVPHRTWPVLIPAGLAGFVLHDVRSGFTLWQSAVLNLGDTIEILIVVLGLKYSFNEIPRLNSLKGLAKYCFFAVFLGPFVSSFVGAAATPGSYVVNWRLWFFSDALAFLTLTPAILSWANARRVWIHRSLHSKLEAAALVGALAFLGYFMFLAPWRTTPSVLIYSVVPFLLWAAVRFGSMGVSTSMIVISFLAIWGAIYGHGPFSGPEPHRNVLSLQLFLMFAAIPFMVLAALAEERERDQEVLHESEERFRLAAQAGRAFAYSWDAATDVIERSGECNKILGIDEATPLTGHQAIARVHPDDREGLLTAIAGLTPENSLLQVTYRISCADGSVIWAEQTSQGYFDEHGKIKRIVGMIVDITERKQGEEAHLRHSAIVESSEDAIISKNLDGLIESWNTGAERMFGYTEAEAIGQPITILIPPEIRDEESKILETLGAGRSIEHYETVRVTKGGKKVDVSLTVSPVRDSTGRVVGASKIARDITDRKRAEEALREMNRALKAQSALLQAREELLKIFVKCAPAGVAMFDRDMRYLQVSDRWCTVYSVDSLQLLGRSHYDAFPDLPERYKEIHRRGLAGETVRADEDRWDREGGTIWTRWEVRPWWNLDELPGGILVFAEDITQRKQMEETLSDMTRKLIEAQELERARIARELHDDVGQRLAMVAIELSQLRNNNDLPSVVRDCMHELQQMTSDITTGVHALSHELHSSTLEYLGLVTGMRSWCREFGQRQELEIDFKSHNVPKLPPEIALCVFRVLQEALHNAAKHSGAKRIEVQLAENSGEIHLIVRDSGKGFNIEVGREHGLGLTSMQERVRLVGGTIAIDSKPLAGTTVHVSVPFNPV